MVELLAQGGEYIAIVTLCVSCWIAGRSVRSAGSDQQTAPLVLAHESIAVAPLALSPVAAPSSPDVDYAPVSANPEALHDLIRTGDLEDEGVLEMLVAMAEDCEALDRANRPWRFASNDTAVIENCEKPRILTRHGRIFGSSADGLAEPLTEDVLARYQVYAQECTERPVRSAGTNPAE